MEAISFGRDNVKKMQNMQHKSKLLNDRIKVTTTNQMKLANFGKPKTNNAKRTWLTGNK